MNTVRKTEPLSSAHDRKGFSSGNADLDRYFQNQAGQDLRRHIAAPFVLAEPDGVVIGYYTLSASSVTMTELPESTTARLPRYPRLPATLIGRLAVDRRFQGQGHGRFLLADALFRTSGSEIASFAVIVDAIDEGARAFYLREGFVEFPDHPMRLFLGMSTIRTLFT